jgi:hypothetical protein
LSACIRRRLAEETDFSEKFRLAAESPSRTGVSGLAARAPETRVNLSNICNDTAVVAWSPVPNAGPAGISKLMLLLALSLEETITSLLPIFSGLGFCPRKDFRSQLRDNFSIAPPNRLRILSSSEWFGLAISAIAFLCPGLETIASRVPATSRNATSLTASQSAPARLRQTNINPIPKNYFFSVPSAFCFAAIFCANPAAYFLY